MEQIKNLSKDTGIPFSVLMRLTPWVTSFDELQILAEDLGEEGIENWLLGMETIVRIKK